MTEKRRGLGRGLGALIPSSAEPEEPASSTSVPTRGGRPVDLFFPAAGDPVTPSRPAAQGARKGSGINKDALRGPASKAAASSPARHHSRTAKGLEGTEGDSGDTSSSSLPGSAAVSAVETPSGSSGSTGGPQGHEAAQGTAGAAEASRVSRETLVEVPGATFAELPIESIHPNRKQPRSVFDEEDMAELVHSIREIGVLQPIVVRPSAENDPDHPYELVMGERRWRASREAGLEAVPAIIRSTQDTDLLRDALLENLHRSQLNPLEEAAAYQQLLDDFECSHEELADRIGRSRPQVTNTLRLMKLPPLVQRRLAAGILSAGHSRALLGLADAAEMEKVAQRIVAEGLSVRATEEIVALSDGLRRPAKAAKPKTGARHERLDYLATSLSDRLDTNVKITLGARKGKVSIEFASVDDLNRIMGVLAPPAS
ncbi:ParB/RepB/Spo0J family partition protein [Arthrobacter sp. APC 3897]|uniref:ParB/RepB/Spo0J family partition protein n=1 Tax=Arthrobacter sp. APC 3897 TaxID=3035204 RepID=UPI0025B3F8CB|nr:ParB/RepB/Spo0J family partition protein [Arthrobacter sp. APC 3897]MDN3483048.1 ParB/RepB/Spo0J family partition protein [Arthrobacter sp. APC 3897]